MHEVPWRRETAGGWLVVTVAGELDIVDADAFRDELVAALGTHDVAVDTTEVRFIDSSGLSALLAAARLQPGSGHRLVLAPGAVVTRLLDLTGTAELFDRRDSLEGVVEAGDRD